MKFKLENFNRNIPDSAMLDDLRKVHERLDAEGVKLSFRSYSEHGLYAASTIATRFGSWNSALIKAGLELLEQKEVSETELFKNLENVWTALGRQPVTRDMKKPLSKYSFQTYADRYGTWRDALASFVQYISEDDDSIEIRTELSKTVASSSGREAKKKRRTTRNISDRMRFRILMRDGFTCQSCGRSPMKEQNVELHVDHLVPWSKGGETVSENLGTKCSKCNLGKGNAFDG